MGGQKLSYHILIFDTVSINVVIIIIIRRSNVIMVMSDLRTYLHVLNPNIQESFVIFES